MNNIGFFKIDPRAKMPTYGTENSACFDLYAVIDCPAGAPHGGFEYLYDYQTLVIGTGLVAKIPEGYSLRIYPRSGLAFKHQVTLLNAEGIIDSDYCDEILVMLYRVPNIGEESEPIKICHGDRIAQAELVKNEKVFLHEITERPTSTTRIGGFGSTGR